MDQSGTKNLSWPLYLAIVVVYVAIIQVGGLLIGSGVENDTDGSFPTVEFMMRHATIPVALSVFFGVAVASWLGWWDQILHDRKPVQHWVRVVPISMLIASVVAIGYANLLDQTLGLVLALVLLVVLVGFGEELMFRGLGVVVFRRNGFTEGKVALYTSIVFGLVHVSNAITTGPQAIFQAIVVSLAGYFLYLSRRVGAGLLLPIVVHASWDFGLLSSQIGPDPEPYFGGLAPILLMVVLGAVLYRRRRRIEPDDQQATAPAPAPAA
jgi:CAAX protease family protein